MVVALCLISVLPRVVLAIYIPFLFFENIKFLGALKAYIRRVLSRLHILIIMQIGSFQMSCNTCFILFFFILLEKLLSKVFLCVCVSWRFDRLTVE